MNFTDIHIHTLAPEKSLLFPGPRCVGQEDMPMVQALLEQSKKTAKSDFMISLPDHLFFRGRRVIEVSGEWLKFRRMESIPPTLETLPSPMPAIMKKILLSDKLLNGGLVYIVGAPGSGKTTTCAASVVSRLLMYGGYGSTVEDPPEMPLNGWHEQGYCAQTWVSGDTCADWQEALRGVLRSQPARTPCMLYVGEVRDAESAAALIRAASSGFLVFATGFGNDIPGAIDNLVRLISGDSDTQSTLNSLAGVLRICMHQRINDHKLSARMLVSAHAHTPIANKIRSGMLIHLEGDIQFQSNQLMSGVDVLDEQSKRAS